MGPTQAPPTPLLLDPKVTNTTTHQEMDSSRKRQKDNEVHSDANGAEATSMTSEDYENHLLGESLMESLASEDTPALGGREETGRLLRNKQQEPTVPRNELMMAPPADLTARFTALDLDDVHERTGSRFAPFTSAQATWMHPPSPLSTANATAADTKFTSLEMSMPYDAALPMPSMGQVFANPTKVGSQLSLQCLAHGFFIVCTESVQRRGPKKKRAVGATAAAQSFPPQYNSMPYYDPGYSAAAMMPNYEPKVDTYASSYSTLSPWDVGIDQFVQQPQFIPTALPSAAPKKTGAAMKKSGFPKPAPQPPPLTQSFAAAASKKPTTFKTTSGREAKPAPLLPIAGGKKPKKYGTSNVAFVSTFPIVNPTARIEGQTVVNGVDVRTLKFVKPSRQCLYWKEPRHKYEQPNCPYWHPREICKYHPHCPMGAVVCGFGHPFCSDKHYCRCNPRVTPHFKQFNHLQRPVDDWEHQGYTGFFLANGGSDEQQPQGSRSRSRAQQTSSSGGKQWMTGPHTQDQREVPPSPPRRVVTYIDEVVKPSEPAISATTSMPKETSVDARKPQQRGGREAKRGGKALTISGGRFISLASFRARTPSNSSNSDDDDEKDGGD